MTVTVKICGLSTAETVRAAAAAGADYIGFVFYEKSRRNVTAEQVAELSRKIPESVMITGVFVNPDDEQLARILKSAPLGLIQLHGNESPGRVRQIKRRFNLPVMKAVSIDSRDHIDRARTYEHVADMLLFDARPPATFEDGLPGGNGLSFDWQLLKGVAWQIPWMLSGGLDADNVTRAITTSGAKTVDVSSGVESRPGEKSITRITGFIREVKKI